MTLLAETAIFLGAAVVTVPVFKRLGMGAVLGYLAAGIAIGPGGLGLIDAVDDTLHFAELGVVLLLFVIGLELQPSRLWALRKPIFGLGTAQLLVTALVLGLIGLAIGQPIGIVVVAAFGLSLSSTAFALQTLAEKSQLTTHYGRAAFGVLLFQDLAVIPLLALIPLLASPATGLEGGLLGAARSLGTLALVVLGGRYLLRPVFRVLAASGIQEIFTAAALLVVIGTGLLMQAAGLSMALGAFLAGVLLADSEYRHELEADIEPFKGLLLGLFFIAVGMSVNLGLLLQYPLIIVALTLTLLLVKGAILLVLGRLHGLTGSAAANLAAIIPQGGEFAFVIFAVAVAAGILPQALSDLLVVVVTLSMVLTPVLFALANAWSRRREVADPREFDVPANEDNAVIIAGFGRFGQIIGRVLSSRKIAFTALDASATHVDFVRRFGNKLYYGDASRLELLRAAGAATARVFVVAVDDPEASIRIIEVVQKHFPHLQIFVRARDRMHVFRLMDLGVRRIVRETFLSSLDMAEDVLRALGTPISVSSATVAKFKDYDRGLLSKQHAVHGDDEKTVAAGRRAAAQLERLFEQDAEALLAEFNESGDTS